VSRADLLAAVDRLLRDQASRALLIHQAIADQFGLGPSDLKAVDLAARAGRALTAGQIAEATGLSSSAVTALLDRMERQGFIARGADPADRRRVIVVSTGKREQEVAQAFQPLRQATQQVLERYSTAELELITGFLQQLDAAMEQLAPSLHTRAP
jgi:DNA-binding MarR family transcriptional regulator